MMVFRTGAIAAGMSSEPNVTLGVRQGIAIKWYPAPRDLWRPE